MNQIREISGTVAGTRMYVNKQANQMQSRAII